MAELSPLALDGWGLFRGILWALLITAHGAALTWLLRAGKPMRWSLAFPLGCVFAMGFVALTSFWRSPAMVWLLMGLPTLVLCVKVFLRDRGVPPMSGHAAGLSDQNSVAGSSEKKRRGTRAGRPCYLPQGLAEWSLALAILAAAGLSLGFLTKPNLNYDVLSYHLPLAHEVLERNLGYVPGNYYSRLPRADSLIFAPALSDRTEFADEAGPRAVLAFAYLSAIGLCGLIAGHLRARRKGRLLAMALFAWQPMAWKALANAQSDLLVACLALAALERALAATAQRSPAQAQLAGLLAGTAAAVKFGAVGIFVVPLLGGFMLAGLVRRKLSLPFAAALGATISLGPWLLRAWALSGHPLHPFAGETPDFSAEQARFVVQVHDPLSPLTLSYWLHLFDSFDFSGYSLELFEPGFLLPPLILLPLLAAFAQKPARWLQSPWTLVTLMAAAGYGAWGLVGQNPDRFLIPWAGVLGAIAATWLFSGSVRLAWRLAGGALLVLGAALSLLRPWLPAGGVSGPSLALEALRPREVWLDIADRSLPSDAYLPLWESEDDATTLLIFESRARRFPPPVRMNTVWDRPPWIDALQTSRDADAFVRALRESGVDRVVVNEFELARLVSFYGVADPPVDSAGVWAGSPPEQFRAVLAAYPPFHFAGLTERDYKVLADFLRLCRRHALRTVPPRPGPALVVCPLDRILIDS